MSKGLVYVLDDEANILHLMKYNLEDEGYSVRTFTSHEMFFKSIYQELPDLVILDIMMPGRDGYQVIGDIRKDKRLMGVPVIFLSAKAEEIDRVFGMEIGADDYMVKPFSVRELLVRVKAMLRREDRMRSASSEVIGAGEVTIDTSKREVRCGSDVIDLTYKEYELLRFLVKNKGIVMSRSLLVENIWGLDFEGDERTVDVHVRCLRQKLKDDSAEPKYIETVRGVGYRFIG